MGSPAALATGATFEDYRVLGMLATGHMGAIYNVEELESGRQRALKLIHSHVIAPGFDPAEFDRVLRSGRELDREHYVEVFRTGVRAADATPWFVMQLLRGENGSARVRSKGPLSAPHVIELFDQSCRALQKAHQRREAHGDLKPENFFFASARRVGMAFSINLLDFGVARFVDTGEKLWKAPEQSAGRGQDPRIDVWALGLVGFFMLTGRSFWDAPDATDPTHGAAVIPPAGHAAATLDAALPYPQAFDAWFSKCVHVDPDARFENAAAVLKGLRKVLAGVPLDAAARRVHSILGAQSQAVTVPEPERAAPGRPSFPGSVPASVAQGPSTLSAPSGVPTQADSLAAPTQLPATQIPSTEIPETRAAATQQVVGTSSKGTQAMGVFDPALAQTELGGSAVQGTALIPAVMDVAPPRPPSPSAAELAATVAAQPSFAGAAGSHSATGSPGSAPPSSSQAVSAPSVVRGGSSAMAKGALGGCAIGALGIAVGGGLVLVVLVVVIVVVASSDGSNTVAATGGALRTPVIGDQAEIREELKIDLEANGKQVKLASSSQRRVQVLSVEGNTPSRMQVEYVIERNETNGKAETSAAQGQTFIVDVSRGQKEIVTAAGQAPSAAQLKDVKDDDLGVGPVSFLPDSEFKVGQSLPMPASLVPTGAQLERGTLTYTGTKDQGGSKVATFDLSLDMRDERDVVKIASKLSGTMELDVSTSRLLLVTMKGPLSASGGGSGSGFMTYTARYSYTDR
ncbi:MAG: serine/threonine-protein kinase [Polyangiaceae bacterium]